MIRAPRMLAIAWGITPHNGAINSCGLCGEVQPSSPWQDVIKDTFTNIDEIRSPYICWACSACINDRRSRSNALVVNDIYSKPERKQIWPLLFNPPIPPFLLYLTASGKKHGIWRQQIATNRSAFKLQCEDLACIFELIKDRRWMQACASLVMAGVRRDNVESGHYDSGDVTRAGINKIREHDAIITLVRKTTKFALVFGQMPGKDDLEEVMACMHS